MKHLAIAAFAAAAFAAPLAFAPEAAAQHRGDRHERSDRGDRHDERYDRRDDRRGDRYDRRADRRDDRRGDRYDRRDHRRDRWDARRYNGYHYNGRWYYGPPPSHYRNVRYDYRQWRRGDRLPRYYRSYYRDIDYRHYRHLRAPPRGYHYVRDDRGDFLLVGIATGVILGVILAH